MERKANQVLADEEFEPFCKWEREKDLDVLKIHVQVFKKEQLKVQISSSGILKISGERPLDAFRKSRFLKEVRLSGNFDASEIHAKFVNGWLHITIPKTTTLVHEQQGRKRAEEKHKIDQIHPPKLEAAPAKDRSSDEPLPRGGGGSEEQSQTPAGNSPEVDDFQEEERDAPSFGVTMVATATLAILIAYAVYVYKCTVGEVDDFII